MASREQIFGILAGASGPMGRIELEEKVGESYRRFQTQLDRWEKQELIEDVGDHHYALTDKGREAALAGPDQAGAAAEEGGAGKPAAISEETLGTTEYQQFLKFGRQTGVTPEALIQQTTGHIWAGGDYRDLKWVALGLQEMAIRQDLRNRWFHSWRSYLKQPIPMDLPAEYLTTDAKKAEEKNEAAKKDGTGKRDYIINEDNLPVYVGEGLGDLDQKDALDLARIRGGPRGKDGRPTTTGSMAEEMAKMFAAFKEIMGEKTQGKSYLLRQGDEGVQVEEVDPNRPMIITQSQGGGKQQPSFFVDGEGNTHEVQPGQPIIIKQPAAAVNPQQGQQYLIDKTSGQVTQIQPGQPIVIQAAPAQSQMSPIQVMDKDGKPMVLDLATFIKLEEHREKQKMDEESHQMKMEIAKGFKDLLKNAQSAVSHMGEEG